jgi:hypothetical protein
MRRFLVSVVLCIALFTLLTITDWDGSDGDYDGSSEPMDSIAELGPADNDDAAL